MEFEKIFVVGAHSSIASYLMSKNLFEKNDIYCAVRSFSNREISWANKAHIFLSDFPNDELTFKKFIDLLCPMNKERVLVINFVGAFGNAQSVSDLNVEDALEIIDVNLGSYLKLIKFFNHLPSGSMMISFSGAGVGGDNMDSSSPGYLASKLSIAGLTEVFNRDFVKLNKSLALIAPGPFPSPMQKAVALARPGAVSESARNKALEVEATDLKIQNLIKALNWAITNPELAGGKTLSAQFDELDSESRSKDFGLLRRVT